MAAGDGATERAALADEVRLADELVERRAGACARRAAAARAVAGTGVRGGRRLVCAGWAWADGSPRRSADLEDPGDVDRDVQHEQDDQQQDRDPGDVLEVAGDVGVLARVVERRVTGVALISRARRAPLLRSAAASGRRCSSATSCASSSAARASSASVRPAGRGAAAARRRGAGRGRRDAGRRVIGLRWPGRVLPRARFAIRGSGASRGRAAGGTAPSAAEDTPDPVSRAAGTGSERSNGDC